MRRPRKRTVGIVLLVVAGLLLVGGAWYVQPQPLLPEAEASLASTPDGDVHARRTRASSGRPPMATTTPG